MHIYFSANVIWTQLVIYYFMLVDTAAWLNCYLYQKLKWEIKWHIFYFARKIWKQLYLSDKCYSWSLIINLLWDPWSYNSVRISSRMSQVLFIWTLWVKKARTMYILNYIISCGSIILQFEGSNFNNVLSMVFMVPGPQRGGKL